MRSHRGIVRAGVGEGGDEGKNREVKRETGKLRGLSPSPKIVYTHRNVLTVHFCNRQLCRPVSTLNCQQKLNRFFDTSTKCSVQLPDHKTKLNINYEKRHVLWAILIYKIICN